MHAIQLTPNHVWKASPGCRILVVDGGSVRFDYPRDWVLLPNTRHVSLIDCYPPSTRGFLGVSWRRISQKESLLPLVYTMHHVALAEERPVLERGPVHRFFRPPLEAVWTQLRVVEPALGREKITRSCIARAGCTQAVILFDVWPQAELAMFDVWQTLIRTIVVGDYIADPATGRRREQRG